ncbi:MAG: hypothetical protein MZU97_05780 [Bacillus subtilis]|nr:hypothetical protein [Bacillus subtilis]
MRTNVLRTPDLDRTQLIYAVHATPMLVAIVRQSLFSPIRLLASTQRRFTAMPSDHDQTCPCSTFLRRGDTL